MKYFCNPINMEYKYQFVKHTRQQQSEGVISVYREAADPSMVFFQGKYYLFPSMTAGFLTSDDFVEWEFHEFCNEMPIYDYAPDVRVIGEYLYFSASKRDENCSFFRTKDPLQEPFEEIEGTFPFWDPNLFCDDDGRIYFYWGCSNITPIYGVELDAETLQPLSKPQVMFGSNNQNRGYERIGDNHVNPRSQEQIRDDIEGMVRQMMSAPAEQRLAYGFTSEDDVRRTASSVMGDNPYIEGAWMTKHNGTYYLQYAIPGTEYNVYGDGVFVSDSPMGPFRLAKNNPYSYKPGGFACGAGHGSTLEDKEGKFWHAATISISKNDAMERRLGLWKAGFDEDGELYCDQRYGDWPVDATKPAFEKPDWMLLSYGKKVKSSSGSDPEFITDENIRTWWKADINKPGEWIEVDLGADYDVRAVQVNFADDRIQVEFPENAKIHITYDERCIDTNKHRTRWILEGSLDGEEYFIIEDKSNTESDYSHELVVREDGVRARYVKLTIIELPYNQNPCVSGLRIFGKAEGMKPLQVTDVLVQKEGDLDLLVSWKDSGAVGYNILWGFAPDKLYHSYMVFEEYSHKIGALIKGEPVYLRVDAFNESGIAEGVVYSV